jgi:hypothetical protein
MGLAGIHVLAFYQRAASMELGFIGPSPIKSRANGASALQHQRFNKAASTQHPTKLGAAPSAADETDRDRGQ